MSLQQLDLSDYDTPAAQVVEVQPEQELVVLKRTRAGHLIAVCTVHPAPQAIADDCAAMVDTETGRKGVPLFTPPEIRSMEGADPELVELVIAQKLAAPGSTVMSILEAQP